MMHHLDLKAEKCPMTFVRARLALEQLPSGEMLEIELSDRETCENVRYSISEMGDFQITKQLYDDSYRLRIKEKEEKL